VARDGVASAAWDFCGANAGRRVLQRLEPGRGIVAEIEYFELAISPCAFCCFVGTLWLSATILLCDRTLLGEADFDLDNLVIPISRPVN
jgi:hypothetical protein